MAKLINDEKQSITLLCDYCGEEILADISNKELGLCIFCEGEEIAQVSK